MTEADPADQRAEMLEGWERAASGWGRRAERVREMGMPVSAWMLEHAHLQPVQRVLELAAGPGDTGFLAAELIQPGGTLISSDAAEAMLDIARERARDLRIANVEFKRLELEWIDLPTADVDAILCRWGVMLSLDPESALRECRRVLRPGGRIALAVWDEPVHNPWATIPTRALVDLGLVEPAEPPAVGMFALSAPGALAGLLENTGFTEVEVDAVRIARGFGSAQEYVEETLDLSQMFSRTFRDLEEAERARVEGEIETLTADYRRSDGTLQLPGRSLVAAASA